MKTMIVYGSKYGTASVYAHKLAQLTKGRCVSYDKVNSLFSYDRIIYVGSIYAGKITGIKEILDVISDHAEIIIVTVGISDPENYKNVAHILNSAKKQLPDAIYKKARFYHLRGALDYRIMSKKDIIMMKMLCLSLKSKSKNKFTDEDKMILDTYGKFIDFTDLSSLNKIINDIK